MTLNCGLSLLMTAPELQIAPLLEAALSARAMLARYSAALCCRSPPPLPQTSTQREPSDHLLQWLQQSIPSAFAKNKESGPRSIVVGKPDASFARNVTRNQKYPAIASPPRCVAVSLCRCSMSLTRYQVPRRYFPPSSHRRAVQNLLQPLLSPRGAQSARSRPQGLHTLHPLFRLFTVVFSLPFFHI